MIGKVKNPSYENTLLDLEITQKERGVANTEVCNFLVITNFVVINLPFSY